jgi:chromosome segregation ATPase
MDNYRMVQILQDIVNNQNNLVSSLNSYISEAQNAPAESFDKGYIDGLNSQINGLNFRVNELQNENQNLMNQVNSNNSGAGAEIDALRGVIDSVSTHRDFLQSQVGERDARIAELEGQANHKSEELQRAMESISTQQADIANLNSKLNDEININHEKQSQIDALSEQVASFHHTLEDAKSKIEAELKEAIDDIDAVLDRVDDKN